MLRGTTASARRAGPSNWGRIGMTIKLAIGYVAVIYLAALRLSVIVIGAGIIVLLVYEATRTRSPEELARAQAEAATQRHQRVCIGDPYSVAEWEVETEYAVRDHLKAPSTAKFKADPILGLLDAKVNRSADCTYTVLGQVDAQNSFGAMIRSLYKVSLVYDAKSDKWTVMSVAIQ